MCYKLHCFIKLIWKRQKNKSPQGFLFCLAKRERELKKLKLREEMEEVKRQSAELHARRRAQEKVLNDMFSQLIEQELKREGEKVQDNKVYSFFNFQKEYQDYDQNHVQYFLMLYFYITGQVISFIF